METDVANIETPCRLSGTRLATSGPLGASGARRPVSSFPPVLWAAAKSPPRSRPCRPSLTTASSTSRSAMPSPLLRCQDWTRSTVARPGALAPLLVLMAPASPRLWSLRLPRSRARISIMPSRAANCKMEDLNK